MSNTLNDNNIQVVDHEQIKKIDALLENVDVAIPSAMSYVRKIQGWNFHQLEKRLEGISLSTLRSYFQPGYQKMRPLHVVAAYSWLTMMPMACFYRGPIVKAAYPDMDDLSLRCLIHSGLLSAEQFKKVQHHIYSYLTKAQKKSVDFYINEIEEKYGKLDQYSDDEFLSPKSIDIQEFAYDYYRSLALGCQKIRVNNNVSVSTMAKVVNLSLYRYQRLEDPENPIPLPVELGARLQLGFNLTNAMHFTIGMEKYAVFHVSRQVQNIRLFILVDILKYFNKNQKLSILNIIEKIGLSMKNIKYEKEQLKEAMDLLI